MVSREQNLERLRKLSIILKELPTCSSIGEVSKRTNIPTSTIQRYLNNKTIFIELFLEDEKTAENSKKAEDMYEAVQQFLIKSKKDGNSKGGKTSYDRYGYTKDSNGKFINSSKNR